MGENLNEIRPIEENLNEIRPIGENLTLIRPMVENLTKIWPMGKKPPNTLQHQNYRKQHFYQRI